MAMPSAHTTEKGDNVRDKADCTSTFTADLHRRGAGTKATPREPGETDSSAESENPLHDLAVDVSGERNAVNSRPTNCGAKASADTSSLERGTFSVTTSTVGNGERRSISRPASIHWNEPMAEPMDYPPSLRQGEVPMDSKFEARTPSDGSYVVSAGRTVSFERTVASADQVE